MLAPHRLMFAVPDMTCDGCVRAVAAAVRQADPAGVVRANLATHAVEVESHLPAEAIAAALRDAGFTPDPR